MDLLRFATAGSVDDGKSTLIGRLLYETKQIFDDQLEAVERTSRDRGFDYVNLALLTDGLRAEREQGITIDVAYRYFSTLQRSFIIADTPGHPQYTRNMVTGCSTADLALVLVDARNGLLEQSRRHSLIASLLRVRHLAVCVNKMDLVGFDESAFEAIREAFTAFAGRLEFADVTFIPMSALQGDNVTSRSARMPWYRGPTLLWHLENVYVGSDRNLIDPRFPVQYVIRPMTDSAHDYRGLAGQVAAGVFRPGDEVVVLPGGQRSRVAGIDLAGRSVDEAYPPESVAIRLEDAIDAGRGDMLCRPNNSATVGQDIEAMVCWFGERPMTAGAMYTIKHTTRNARASIRSLRYRLDVNTLSRDEAAEELALNEVGRIALRTTVPLCYDEYRRNRTTGSFILIDDATNATVAAGMIRGPASG